MVDRRRGRSAARLFPPGSSDRPPLLDVSRRALWLRRRSALADARCLRMRAAPVFFEIGARTNFSFLEGASSPEDMVLRATQLKLSGLGIADRNSVAGVVRAYSQQQAIVEQYERKKREDLECRKKGEKEEALLKPVPVQPGARIVFS